MANTTSKSNATSSSAPDTPESLEELREAISNKAPDKSSQSIRLSTTVPPPTTLPSSWPPYDSCDTSRSSFPSDSLLAGTEPLVWQALGTLAPRLEEFSKQVALRQALRSIRLGWIATNTTPFRIVVGKLYDQALACAKEQEHRCQNKRVKHTPPEPLPSIQIDTTPIPPNSAIQGPFNLPATFTKDQREAVWRDLETYGACLVRKAVSVSDVATLTPNTTMPDTKKGIKIHRLAETMGNGIAGAPSSRYSDVPKPYSESLLELETTLWNLLLTDEKDKDGQGAKDADNESTAFLQFSKGARSPRKSLFLQYGIGAENWAHQDNNKEDVPIQAVLLTSEPGADFEGGEFYVATRKQQNQDDDKGEDEDSNVLKFRRHIVPWENAGDLVLFQAGKDTGWWHGMMPVKEVTSQREGDTDHNNEDTYARQTIGMLQPF